MDGNDSLKRMHRREQVVDELGEGMGETKEKVDFREGSGDYFLPRKEFDEWDIHLDLNAPDDATDEPAGCDSWHNSQESNTRAMCRFFGILPPELRGGYDIGCTFDSILRKSWLGPRALQELYTSIVGLFHGYSHNGLCQLLKLVLYQEGMGLEDFETCERFFSASNSLATAIRHTSVFHQRQTISKYVHHYDSFHTYANISAFLVNNYKQALDILTTEPALILSMKEMGLSSRDVFEDWLKEELEYLKTRVKSVVPEQEKLEIKYYLSTRYLLLVKFKETCDTLHAVQQAWIKVDTPETVLSSERDKTATIETKRRQARERYKVQLEEVHTMEGRLGIIPQDRWKDGDSNWVLNEERAAMSIYRKCLDRLEGLVVERLLELAKANQSQTGYNMRKHIGQAVKTRSQAIRTALEKYNVAAAKISPPRQALDWDTVIECAFLSEFELLRDAQQDIRERPWTKPAGQALQDKHFKILHAEEEII
ncbi:hypothetical protein C8J56DRAFT_1051139 [Mycena floridula]|nr:hypothetical protein C8J56DRAFT_1051139 [Mycena floridula]